MPEIKIHLIPDRNHIHDVGKLDSGANYWIDCQLVVENRETRDFVCAYVFNAEGTLIWHEIVDAGIRSARNQREIRSIIEGLKRKLGDNKRSDIWVYPFSIEAYGNIFGLVVRKPGPDDPEDMHDDTGPLVDALPGWTLMFYPPWDEGLYDT